MGNIIEKVRTLKELKLKKIRLKKYQFIRTKITVKLEKYQLIRAKIRKNELTGTKNEKTLTFKDQKHIYGGV